MEHLNLLAKYNYWADSKLLDRIDELEERLLDREVKSSFNTIRKTMGHMFDAQRIWLNRLNGRSLSNWPSSEIELFTTNHLRAESRAALDFVTGMSEQDMNKICTYQNRGGDSFQQSAQEILLHLFNHGTYHRGQLVTMMRMLGEENMPSTDIIFYLREKG